MVKIGFLQQRFDDRMFELIWKGVRRKIQIDDVGYIVGSRTDRHCLRSGVVLGSIVISFVYFLLAQRSALMPK